MAAVKTEAQYKQYFSGSFKGMDSIIKDVLTPIFGTFTPTTSPTSVDYADNAHFGNGGANIDHIYDYGTFYTDKVDVSVFEVILNDNCHISIARKNIQNTVRRITETYSGAFIVFHYSDGSRNAEAQTWRLSWLKRLDVHRKDSPAKRYTYLCGPSYSCRTIAQRFDELQKNRSKTLDSITKAFDVEALSKDFFYEYKVFYDDIIQWITGTRYVGEKDCERKDNLEKSDVDIYTPFAKKCGDEYKREWGAWTEKQRIEKIEKFIRDWVKKLMGRMVFLQFIQKKGWLGIREKVSDWKGGSQNFLLERFDECSANNKNFLKDELYAILFDSLNKFECEDAGGVEITKRDGLKYPFLNGGLFEDDTLHIKLPNKFFHNEDKKDISRSIGKKGFREKENEFFEYCGLLDFFGHYNFTIDENASEDEESEVGIDPEMLSKVFENLLEDNKEKGAFYTPKEIVQYMCKESLISYLCTEIKGIDNEIRSFVETQSIDKNLQNQKEEILNALHKVKICDPAVGSGAFPMGLLNLILKLRLVLNDDIVCTDKGYDYAILMSKIENAESGNNEDGCKQEKAKLARIKCAIKKHIIQNNIYGVDIEKGAVDLARLRFWLNIVVDEDKPTPLPNLDFKIMQGNSLLECYEEIDLSNLVGMKTRRNCEVQCDLFGNIEGVDKEALYVGDKFLRFDLQQEMDGFIIISDPVKKKEIRQRIEEYIHCALCNTLAVRKWEIQASIDKLNCLPKLSNRQQKELNKKESEKKALDIAIENLQSVVNDKFFLWHTWFADVFENGGFDIVIGNPPYIKEYTNKAAFDGFRETSPYFMGKMDLWYGFACHGIDFLKSNGVLCFIAQNNWTTSEGAKKMRNKVIKDSKIIQLIDFNTYMVFESADIQTMVMLFQRDQRIDNYRFDLRIITHGNEREDMLALLAKQKRNTKYLSPIIERVAFIDKLLTFSGSDNNQLFEKIAKNKTYLQNDEATNGIHTHHDCVTNKIHRAFPDLPVGKGIFVLSSSEKNALNLTKDENRLIKPYFTSDEIMRYYTTPHNHLWIIYTTSEFKQENSLDNYPQIKKHLDLVKKTITSDYKPYGLHRAREERFFEGEKIASLRKCEGRPCFSYSDFDCFIPAMYYVIKTSRWNMKFLTGVLNSQLVAFWLRHKGKMQGNNYQVDKNPLQEIPLPIIDMNRQQPFISLVDQILAAKKTDPKNDTTTLEHKIDILVYLLYGLTWDEVQIVENSLL